VVVTVTKRYREQLEDVVLGARAGGAPEAGVTDGADPDDDPRGAGAPTSFRWRGRPYTVRQVLGHWREDAGWWRAPDGVPIQLQRADLWRVEAGGADGDGRGGGGGDAAWGVYELVRKGGAWRLDRVWD
jgi:hypothetical protein